MKRAHSAESTLKELICPDCSYNLSGISARRCPECGRTFDPFWLSLTHPKPTSLLMGLFRLAGLLVVGALLALVIAKLAGVLWACVFVLVSTPLVIGIALYYHAYID